MHRLVGISRRLLQIFHLNWRLRLTRTIRFTTSSLELSLALIYFLSIMVALWTGAQIWQERCANLMRAISMARQFDAEAHIVGLNTLRHQLAKTPFTSDTIREGFKSCGIPSNPVFWTVFSSSGLVKQVGDNLYCFNNPNKPIHFHKLTEIYKEYQKKVNAYHNKWYDKKRRKDVLKRPDIQAAIKLLRENGMDVVLSVQKICLDI